MIYSNQSEMKPPTKTKKKKERNWNNTESVNSDADGNT